MKAGVRTPDIDPATLLDTVLGNRAGSTVRATVAALATQLVASGPLATALTNVLAQITSGLIAQATWAALVGIAPVANGTGGEVLDSDAGTHPAASATGYDGASVPNAGRYSWNATWGRWVRIGDTGLSAIAELEARLAALEEVDVIIDLVDDGAPWILTIEDEWGWIGFGVRSNLELAAYMPVSPGGPETSGRFTVTPTATFLTPPFHITGIVGTGQSWMDQNGSNGRLLNTALYPESVLTLLDGARFKGYGGSAPPGASNGFVAGSDIVDTYQTIIGPAAYRMAHDAADAGRVMTFYARQEGRAGAAIEELYPEDMVGASGNGQPWRNFERAVISAKNHALSAGTGLVIPIWVFCQGQGDVGDSYEAYLASLNQYFDRGQAMIMAATGQRQRPRILLIQSPSAVTGGDAETFRAHADICQARPDVILACAGWGYDQHDGIHFAGGGAVDCGEVVGICATKVIDGEDWSSPYLINPRRSGAVVTFDVAGSHGVIIDERVVSDRHQIGGEVVIVEGEEEGDEAVETYVGGTPVPNYGFEAWDVATQTELAIASVDVDYRHIRVTLAEVPTADCRVQYAMHAASRGDGRSANRGTIRADWLMPSACLPGRPLRRWLASNAFTFTV